MATKNLLTSPTQFARKSHGFDDKILIKLTDALLSFGGWRDAPRFRLHGPEEESGTITCGNDTDDTTAGMISGSMLASLCFTPCKGFGLATRRRWSTE
ncbi:hypothetical protein ACJRO7_017726 [Eucalyptus globulus]|uniref:Uncharacterized protein n=1 Tax=Eucalyptus globulus TaxID=34317 RepID=A0ABD3L2B7_EUCGL